MNYFDGKFLAVLLVLIRSTFALDKDVTLSIGVSVISTFTVCAILSLIAWNCCLRSHGARKHQFDAEQDCNKGLVLANYDNIHNTAKTEAITTLQCPKCGHRIERNNLSYAGSSDGRRVNSVKTKSNGCKGTSVDVVVHNNSRSMNSATETTIVSNTQKLETNKEESSTALAIEERSTFEVKLKKTESGSLGLSIVGGRSSRLGDIGVFIKSTIENTPAASNGLLTPWDQILKVNNIDLDGKTLEEALMVIKEQSEDITLTILPSEQATAHLEASLSIKAAQLDDNRMKADWSSLREADEITPDGISETDQGNKEAPSRSDTCKTTCDVTKSRDVTPQSRADSTNVNCGATDSFSDVASFTSSLPQVTSLNSKRSGQAALSSREIPDSEISLSPIHETDLIAKDDDVFYAPSPTTPKGLFSGVGLVNVTNSKLRGEKSGGENTARRADHVIEGAERGFQGTLETDSIRVDLDSEIQPIGQDIVVQ